MGEESTWRVGEGAERGVIFDEGYRSLLASRVRRTGIVVWMLVCMALVVVGLSLWFVVEEAIKRPEILRGEVESTAVGSGLSHEVQTDDGWSYRLDVEEIIAEDRGVGGGLFGLAHLREARVTIFGEEAEESLVFYAPKVLWREDEGLFHMMGGCRVWQGDQLDITTEEIIVNVKTRNVEIPGSLKGRYGEGWFFEAESARWDIAKDNLVLEGIMTLGREGESL